MKTVILDLLDIVNENIEYIEMKYPEISDVLYQINLLLKNNPTDKQILEWMLSNQSVIENINECIKNIKKTF